MCIWDLQCFETFRNCCLFCTFWHIRSFYCGEAHHANYTKQFKSSFPTLLTLCLWDLKYFQSFRNSCLFCTFCCFWNLNSAGYGKRCSNHHFQHCPQCVYEIYSVFKDFEISVCFAHFGLFEISTPVMSNILTMANIVKMIITNIAHTVYMTFTVFSKFSKWLFVLHILAYSKFELHWVSPS